MVRGEAASPEPYQTVSTVYFILGILRTDLWCQGQWRDKKWRKVPCPRKQRDGRGLSLGVWGVSPSATHASTGLTEMFTSGFTYSGSRNGKIYLLNYWMKFLWYPIRLFSYTMLTSHGTHILFDITLRNHAVRLQSTESIICLRKTGKSVL